MLFLCRAETLYPSDGATWSPPGEVRQAFRHVAGRGLVAICDLKPCDIPDSDARRPDQVLSFIPLEEGFARASIEGGFTVMLHLKWDSAARGLDGLWPEVVQALQMQKTPRVVGVYRLAAQQDVLVFAEVGHAGELNNLAATRLFHGVSMEQVTALGAPLHASVLRSEAGSESASASGETPASSQRLPVM
jgi:hypothetical protein